MAKRLNQDDVVNTMRLLLAVAVQQYGVMNMLVMTRKELEAAAEGTLTVQDRSDGSIVLRVKGGRKPILRVV
jgi:hypothetical protein